MILFCLFCRVVSDSAFLWSQTGKVGSFNLLWGNHLSALCETLVQSRIECWVNLCRVVPTSPPVWPFFIADLGVVWRVVIDLFILDITLQLSLAEWLVFGQIQFRIEFIFVQETKNLCCTHMRVVSFFRSGTIISSNLRSEKQKRMLILRVWKTRWSHCIAE